MKFNLIFNKFIIINSLILCFLLTSCYKNKSTIAVIRVLDINSEQPISGASVRVFYEDSTGVNTSVIDFDSETTLEGVASFDFSEYYQDGQAGFAVLDIEVNGTFSGVIMVEEMVVTEKIIYL